MDFHCVLNNGFNENTKMLNCIKDLSILAGSHLNKIGLNNNNPDNEFNYSHLNESTIVAGNILQHTMENNNDKCINNKRNHEQTIVLDQDESIDANNDSKIDALNTNIDAMIDHQSEIFYDSLECDQTDSLSLSRSVKNISPGQKLTPLVEVTSFEQANGIFRIQMHLKGFKEEEKSASKLKFKQLTHDAQGNSSKIYLQENKCFMNLSQL